MFDGVNELNDLMSVSCVLVQSMLQDQLHTEKW